MAPPPPPGESRLPTWLREAPLRSLSELRACVGEGSSFEQSALALADSLDRLVAEEPEETRTLLVTLEGPWGTGKSSFARVLVEGLCDHPKAAARPLELTFNVWQSLSPQLSAWSALAYRIGEALYRDLHRRARRAAREGETLYLGGPRRGDAEQVVELDCGSFEDERLHWLEVAHRLADAVPDEHWHPCLKLFCDAPSKVPGRGMDWRSGRGVLERLLFGVAQSALSAKPAGVVAAVGAAVQEFDQRRLTEGPTWGVETLEFALQLDRLLRVLRPNARSWRLVITVEDTARARDDKELQLLLDALGYLRELHGVLVLITLDPLVAERLGTLGGEPRPSPEVGPREDFITRLVDARHGIPAWPVGDLAALVRSWWESLGLPTWDDGCCADDLARALVPRWVRTPRQLKRALFWLWTRLANEPRRELLEELRDPRTQGQEAIALLRFLALIHLHRERRCEAEELWEAAGTDGTLLLRFATRPWDDVAWTDRQLRRYVGLSSDALGLDLAGQLRRVALARALGVSALEEEARESARRCWADWRDQLSPEGDDPAALSSLGDDLGPRRLVQLLRGTPPVVYSDLVMQGSLANAARWLGVASEEPVEEEAPLGTAWVLERWFDLDCLATAIRRPDTLREARDLARLLRRAYHEQPREQGGERRTPTGQPR